MDHPLQFDADDPVLHRLRSIALALPEAVETVTFGRPWFRAGRVFAVYGSATKGPEKTQHPRAVIVHVDDDERPARLQDPRFFVPGYFGPKGWLGIDLDPPDTDWAEVAELLDAGHRFAAPPRLRRTVERDGR
ncbi:MmcQ/YjbR family DNA-binding protein [uncultured Amnibacterium sp.]|uniref:MmcQ/YjbR family DNA-binding protein n=1 Tax=uncultured Amnibacterium sp. TaxID=1631851 RepID=UPI0035CA6BB4